jgi:hypothetical protein
MPDPSAITSPKNFSVTYKGEPVPTGPETVIQEADRIINGQRRQDYGGAKESFTRIATLWGPILGMDVTPQQVALCMVQLKIARFVNGSQRDSVVDIIGYAALLAKIEGWE